MKTKIAFALVVILGWKTEAQIYDANGDCVQTFAGSGLAGYVDGVGPLAMFNNPNFIWDSNNQQIRSITNNPTAQVVSGANLGIGIFTAVAITGFDGRAYQLQSSPDLNSWTTKATILLNSSPYRWIDQNPVSGNKCYRALLLP